MPVLNTGQVTTSGQGIGGLLNVWRTFIRLVTSDIPALIVALGRLGQ